MSSMSPPNHSRATTEPAWVRYTLIGIALTFLSLFLFVPLVSVFVEAFKKEGSVENLKFLLARAEEARDVLPDELTKLGAIVDVAAAYRNIVDVVRRIAVARQHALDRDLAVLSPLAADAALAVVEMQLDRGAADRRPITGAIEDHVLHRLAAQCGGLGFAQHPAHGVDDVRLAATVGADDA